MNRREITGFFILLGLLASVLIIGWCTDYQYIHNKVRVKNFSCADKHIDNIERNFKVLEEKEGHTGVKDAITEMMSFYSDHEKEFVGDISIFLTKDGCTLSWDSKSNSIEFYSSTLKEYIPFYDEPFVIYISDIDNIEIRGNIELIFERNKISELEDEMYKKFGDIFAIADNVDITMKYGDYESSPTYYIEINYALRKNGRYDPEDVLKQWKGYQQKIQKQIEAEIKELDESSYLENYDLKVKRIKKLFELLIFSESIKRVSYNEYFKWLDGYLTQGGKIEDYTNRWINKDWYLISKDCVVPLIECRKMFIVQKGVKIEKRKHYGVGCESVFFYMDDYTVDPSYFPVFMTLNEKEDC